jgi:sulfite exporter TauE/SafE
MITSNYIPMTAFLLGLIGSVHCAVMCGGIAGYLQKGSTTSSAILLSLAMSAGRLASYALAGTIASLVGSSLVGWAGPEISHNLMQLFVGLFLILLGISLTGRWNGLSWVEKQGGHFWKILSPFTRHVLPATTYPRAFAAGALWGWLPCGLVYSALVLVMGSGDVITGAGSMIAFGIGTLPVLTFIGVTSWHLQVKSKPLVRQSAGAIVMLFGVMVFTGLFMSGAAHP